MEPPTANLQASPPPAAPLWSGWLVIEKKRNSIENVRILIFLLPPLWYGWVAMEIKRILIENERISIELQRISIQKLKILIEIERNLIEIERISIEIERISIEIERISIEIERISSRRPGTRRFDMPPPQWSWYHTIRVGDHGLTTADHIFHHVLAQGLEAPPIMT